MTTDNRNFYGMRGAFPETDLLRAERERLTGTRGGRRQAFGQYLQADPFYQYTTPQARGALASRFDPYNVQFQLNALTGQGGTPGIFRDYLAGPESAGVGAMRGGWNAPTYASRFEQLARQLPLRPYTASMSQGVNQPETVADFETRRRDFWGTPEVLAIPASEGVAAREGVAAVPGTATVEQEAAFAELMDDPNAEDIITQASLAGTHPLLRGAVADALARRFAAFRDRNVSTPIFQEFANRNWSF